MNQLESVACQAREAASNQIARGAAEVRRETSIVNPAMAAMGEAQMRLNHRIQKSGVYTRADEVKQYKAVDTAYSTPRSVPIFDIKSPGRLRGERLSPVQKMQVEPGYYSKQILRVTFYVLLGAAIVGACAVLLRYWGY